MVRLRSGKRSEICWAIGCRITYSLQISFLDCLFFYPTYYINACVLFLYLNFSGFSSPSTKLQISFVFLRLPDFKFGWWTDHYCVPSFVALPPFVLRQKIAHSFAPLWWMDSRLGLDY